MQRPPLENPADLQKVFRCCPNELDAMRNQRRVSETCMQSGTLTPIILVQNERLENLDEGIISLSRFLADIERSTTRTTKLTHQSFTLRDWNISDGHFVNMTVEGDNDDINKRFWRICGPGITTLTLSRCTIPYNLSVLPSAFWKAVPNLENLSLLNCVMRTNPDMFPTVNNLAIWQAGVMSRRLVRTERQIQSFNATLKNPGIVKNPAQLTAAIQCCKAAVNKLEEEREPFLDVMARGYVIDEYKMTQNLLKQSKDLLSPPLKLESLEIQNLQNSRRKVTISWSTQVNIFPNLKHLSVRQQDDAALEIPAGETLEQKLMEVDLVNFSSSLDRINCGSLLKIPTESLSFDCGVRTEHGDVLAVLDRQATSFRKLCLFRAPYDILYYTFPCQVQFLNLTALHIWGNVARSLNFLQLTPSLKQLKWNTICYDEATHGVRLHGVLGQTPQLLNAEDIVQETADNFVLESVKMLQLEAGQLSVNSLEKLGRWLPNMKAFKATFIGNDKLSQIGKQWPGLEHLELAHGSLVFAEEILAAIETQKAFQSLKRFTWKGCACFVGFLKEEELSAISKLRATCGENVVHPWSEQGSSGGNCLRVLYYKALSTGERDSIDEFNRALNALT